MADLRIAKRELGRIRKDTEAKEAVKKHEELELLLGIFSEAISKNKSACDVLQCLTKDDVRFIAQKIGDRLSDVLSDNEAELEAHRYRRAEKAKRRSQKTQKRDGIPAHQFRNSNE